MNEPRGLAAEEWIGATRRLAAGEATTSASGATRDACEWRCMSPDAPT